MQMLNGLQVTAILQARLQLRVFDQIAAGKGQAGTIAAAIDADERGTRILLDALAALELLNAITTSTGSPPWPMHSWSATGQPTWAGRSTSCSAVGMDQPTSGWPRSFAMAAPSSTSTPRHLSTRSGRRSRPPA